MSRRALVPVGLCLLLMSAIAACQEEQRARAPTRPDADARCADGAETIDVEEEEAPAVQCPGRTRELLCFGAWAAHCDADGRLVDLVNCRESGEVCAPRECDNAEECTGCRACVPRSVTCGDDGELFACDAEGADYELAETCDEAAGEYCGVEARSCADLCQVAEDSHSYIGCEYWAVPTRNSQLAFEGRDADALCRPFPFAVVIANPQGVAADVTVESPGQSASVHRVAPGETETIELPCSPTFRGDPYEPAASARSRRVAHHIRSNVPVTVYQFNPLEFEDELVDGTPIYSYTNDASLLLPVHAMTGRYVVMSSPTMLSDFDAPEEDLLGLPSNSVPGFVAITGVQEQPTRVTITSSAYTVGSEDGEIPPLEPGDRLEIVLAKGEVLQLLTGTPDECAGEPEESTRLGLLTYCEVSQDYDLTGTRIEADGKVSVISGHDCTFLPRNRWACDHLEETMLPVQAWGKEIWMSVTEGVACQPDVPNLVRVLSDSDDNLVTFVPEVHAPVTLNAGDYVQFEYREDFRVSAAEPVLVAQYLLGQEYEGTGSAGTLGKGDPALSIGIPFAQWRQDYTILAPETFPLNYVNIIAHNAQRVLLDGRMLRGLRPIEGTEMATARVLLSGGEHHLESQTPFGIVVYGYATYTSYMVPGGFNVNLINSLD